MRKSLPILALLVPAAASAQTYHLTDLGTLGATGSIGRSVNDLGQVAGDIVTSNGATHAFLYTPGTGMRYLDDGGSASHGYGVNASGQVAGTIDSNPNNSVFTSAFLSAPDGGTLKNLGALGGLGSYGYAVNTSGQVAGFLTLQTGHLVFPKHSFLSAPNGGDLQDLTPNAPSSVVCIGFAVNDKGQVAGSSITDSHHAVLFGTGPVGAFKNSHGQLVNPISDGYGVNASGQVTGGFATFPNGGTHAYLSAANGGAMTDLGTLGGLSSVGRAVSEAGGVVGESAILSGASHAFLYTATAGMRDLNGLLDPSGAGWTLTTAYGLSNTGYITGVGTFNGQSRAFLLTQAVPEPAALLPLGLGALALLRRRRR